MPLDHKKLEAYQQYLQLRQWKGIPVVVMILLQKENQVLLGLRQNSGFMDGYYALPGGRHDERETLTQAAVREAKEELGIISRIQDISFCHMIHFMYQEADRELVYVTFRIHAYEGILRNAEPHKCKEIQFFPLDSLPNNITDMSKICILNALEGKYYDQIGW